MAKKSKKNQEYKTLLSVLANGSTEKASSVLKKYSGETARDTKDLEVKLARMYAISPSKIDIEKDFANIHPHKDFILKYTEVKKAVVEPKVQPEQNNYTDLPKNTTTIALEPTSNANGNCECNCPCCSAKYSNAEGMPQTPNQPMDKNVIFGLVSVVGIIGLVLYFSNKK